MGYYSSFPCSCIQKFRKPQQIDGFLYRVILKFLQPVAVYLPLIFPVITFILLFSQAVYFNKLVNDQRIMQRPHYLTGMSYLLITSLFMEWNMLVIAAHHKQFTDLGMVKNERTATVIKNQKQPYSISVLPLALLLFFIFRPLHLLH